MSNVIEPYDPTVSANNPDLYYYTDMATNGQLKRLQQKNSDLNYMQFLHSENQVQYFQNFIINKIGYSVALNVKLMYIKKELRNVDWFFLSKSGLLQDEFITLVLSKKWMVYNGLISDSEYYIPIKIIHYLHPAELCRTHNLTKIVNNIYFEDDNLEISSSSDSSSSSLVIKQNTGMLFQKILRILHEDRIEYSESNLYTIKDRSQYETQQQYENAVTEYRNKNRYLETAKDKDTDYQDITNEDQSITKVQPCIYDDFVQFIKTKAVHTQNKSSYYTPRFSNQKYLIDNVDTNNIYIGYNMTIPKPILQFTTVDKKYMDLYHQVTWNYTENQDGSISSSSAVSTPKMYIADHFRNCGMDRINLLKHQDGLPLDFVCKYYTMSQLCKYYRFTPQQLLENSQGLIITYGNEENTQLTPWDLQTLFTYNSFDMSDPNMIAFYENIKSNIEQDNKNVIYNAITSYQKLIDESSSDNMIYNSYSSLFDVDNTPSLFDKTNANKVKLQPNNQKFTKHLELGLSNTNSNYYNIRQIDSTNGNLYINNINNYISKYTDNVLMVNTKKDVKIAILNCMKRKSKDGNLSSLYGIYRNATTSEITTENNGFTHIGTSIVENDENNNIYINVCVRCHKQQFFHIDKGNAMQHVTRTPIPIAIQHIIKTNGTGWENNQFVGDYYYPTNNSADSNGYIICGNADMMRENIGCCTLLKAKVYLEDIIAILDNGLLACNRVKIVDPRLYYPTYKIKVYESGATGNKLYIYQQKFVELNI